MKKNFVVVPALVLGVALVASAQTPGTPLVKPPAPQASGVLPTKIAIINVQQAIMSTADGRKAATEMQAKFNPRQEQLKKMQADIGALQDQMKKGSATMSDDAKAKLARDIDGKTKSFQRDADELNADIEQENGRLMQDLGSKMQAVWEQYLGQNGYALLLDVSSQQTPVLWAAAAVDITPDIVKLYDQAHPVVGGAAAAPARLAAPPAAPPPRRRSSESIQGVQSQQGVRIPMSKLVGFTVALLVASSVFAQTRANFSNPTPVVTGGVGSVVFPAGTPQNYPGIQRFNPNVIYPGGGGPRLVVPNATGRPVHRNNNGSNAYAYPVYVGSYGNMYDPSAYGGQPQQQQQPGVTIIMPPQQPPVVINPYDPVPHPQMNVYQPEPQAASSPQVDDTTPEPAHYLLAFKDHTIYSAVAYWVDGDTLHYFTSGNTHNQVSVSLIDRTMTERLNKDAGVAVKLPPVH